MDITLIIFKLEGVQRLRDSTTSQQWKEKTTCSEYIHWPHVSFFSISQASSATPGWSAVLERYCGCGEPLTLTSKYVCRLTKPEVKMEKCLTLYVIYGNLIQKFTDKNEQN